MQLFVRALIPIAIILCGFVAWKFLGVAPEKEEVVIGEPQLLKTEKVVLKPTDYQIKISTQGIVRATQMTVITPLVDGTVMEIGTNFEDGAFFQKDEILLRLDPADLETSVFASESRLARAEAALIQEKARAKQAALNWQDIGYDEEPSPLVLRIPQLREAEANVSAAQAEVQQAKRNLDRADVRAPFAGRVKERLVGVGQAVSATSSLGEIFGTANAEIRLPLAPSQLPFVNLPSKNNPTSTTVSLTESVSQQTTDLPHQWKAEIIRTEGTLDPDSRELFAIARIEDPFGLNSDLPELRIGQPLNATITGNIVDDIFVIPRSAMRGMNRIFLIDNQDPKILKREITPLWSNADVVLVREGLNPGDWLAISGLPYAPDEAPVHIIPTPASEGTATADVPTKEGDS